MLTNYPIALFRPYLDAVKSRCVDSCNRDRLVEDFNQNIK